MFIVFRDIRILGLRICWDYIVFTAFRGIRDIRL